MLRSKLIPHYRQSFGLNKLPSKPKSAEEINGDAHQSVFKAVCRNMPKHTEREMWDFYLSDNFPLNSATIFEESKRVPMKRNKENILISL